MSAPHPRERELLELVVAALRGLDDDRIACVDSGGPDGPVEVEWFDGTVLLVEVEEEL